MKSFSEKLKNARIQKGITSMQLAKQCGITYGYCWQLENRNIKAKQEVIVKLCEALSLNSDEMILLNSVNITAHALQKSKDAKKALRKEKKDHRSGLVLHKNNIEDEINGYTTKGIK